jgi:hypothetical protein
MPRHLGSAVVDDQVGGVQVHPDLSADQPDRDGIPVRADRDLAEPVDPRGQPGARLERLVRQRCQQRLLDCELLADSLRP